MSKQSRRKAAEKKAAKKAASTNAQRRRRYSQMAENGEVGVRAEKRSRRPLSNRSYAQTTAPEGHPYADVPDSYGHAQSRNFAAYVTDQYSFEEGKTKPVAHVHATYGLEVSSLTYRLDPERTLPPGIARVLEVEYRRTGRKAHNLRNTQSVFKHPKGPGGTGLKGETDEIEELIRRVEQDLQRGKHRRE